MVDLDASFLAALAIATLAGTIFGLTGFGFALISVPVLLVVYDAATAVMLTLVLSLFTCTLVILDARRSIEARVVLGMLPGSIIGLVAGSYILALANADTIKVIAGAVVVAFALLLLRGVRLPGSQHYLSVPVAGCASGMLATSTGLSGPPAVMLLAARDYARDTFRANMALYFVVINAIGLATLGFQGLLTTDQFIVTAKLLPLTLLGTIGGARLARYVPPALFRRLTLILLLLTGAIGVVTAAIALL